MRTRAGQLLSHLLLILACLPALVQATPAIESWITDKGTKVMYVHAPDLPMVDIRLVFDAGSARDGEKPGLSTYVNTLLNDGAGDRNADQLAEAFEDLGARFSVSSLRDMGIISLRTLTDETVLQQSLDIFASTVTSPRFSEQDIERRRQQFLTSLKQQEQDAGSVASRAFYKNIYGDHPYAHDPLGNERSLSAITREDIRQFFNTYYVAANLVIAIVGDVDRGQAESMVDNLTAGMLQGDKAPPLPKVVFKDGGVEKISFPATQTHLYLGQPGMSRDDPDYFPLYVGNHMFGGSGLVSMLGEEVREKRGLSYSVYSYFLPMRAPGPFMMVAQTRNERADEALGVMRSALQDFIANGPTEERLVASKKNISGGFPLRVSANSKIVEYIAMMGFYDYPLSYLDDFVARVEAVTVEQIREAFSKRLDTDRFVTVLVGGDADAGQ